MSSAGRSPAQRNTNVTAVVPVGNGGVNHRGNWYSVSVDPRHCSVFTVDMANLTPQYRNADIINYYPGSTPLTGTQHLFKIYMVIDPTIAKYNPGLEFTLFFTNAKNLVDNFKSWIDFFPPSSDDIDILSPPVNYGDRSAFAQYNTQCLTFKSDGDAFRLTASGPVAWTFSGYD